jgi:hypothetical protein
LSTLLYNHFINSFAREIAGGLCFAICNGGEMSRDWKELTTPTDWERISQEVGLEIGDAIRELSIETVEATPVPRHVHLSTINKFLGWIGLALVVAIRPDHSKGTAFWLEGKGRDD